MVTNNEAVDNFLNGKRNLAAYQFSQLIKETTTTNKKLPQAATNSNHLHHSSSSSTSSPIVTAATSLQFGNELLAPKTNNLTSTNTYLNDTSNNIGHSQTSQPQQNVNCDEIAFNYAMVNLFTGCPKRASIIFSDLVQRYPRNPRLWLRLAESMLAAERSKMSEFECIQQLAQPKSRDHLIKTKNKPVLIKVNPNYCQQQKLQHASNKAPPETPPNFLANIKGYLQKSLDLITEYNDISLLTDDIPTNTESDPKQTRSVPTMQDLFGSTSANSNLATTSAPIDYFSDSLTATAKIDSQIQQQQQQLLLQQQQQQQQQRASSSSATSQPNSQLSQQLSYANPYKSISRSALYHLRIKVQLNLAYICLCMGEPIKALAYTTQCLKSSPQGYEKVLASLYHAEACILASRIDEAIQFLNLEVLNLSKNLSQDNKHNLGDTGRVVYSDEMLHQFDKDALATVVTYNLSVAYAAKGEFNNAQKILTRCIVPTKHIPMQLIICLLYIQLQQGQIEAAKKTILSNLPQFR